MVDVFSVGIHFVGDLLGILGLADDTAAHAAEDVEENTSGSLAGFDPGLEVGNHIHQ